MTVDDELDRDLVLHSSSFANGVVSWDHKTTAKVSPKALVIKDGANTIKFEKCARDRLRIETRREEIVYETCSLGHRHEKSKTASVYQWFQIDDEFMTNIAEWLNSGTWTDIKGDRAPYKKVLREVDEFLVELTKRDELMKPICQKLRTKIRGVL